MTTAVDNAAALGSGMLLVCGLDGEVILKVQVLKLSLLQKRKRDCVLDNEQPRILHIHPTMQLNQAHLLSSSRIPNQDRTMTPQAVYSPDRVSYREATIVY
jgi:hypothetical protein